MSKIFSALQDNRSLSDNGEYLAYIHSVLSKNDLTGFKHHPVYNLILEHAMYEQGVAYLNYITNQTPEFIDIIDKFRINDIIGNQEYDITGQPAFFEYGVAGRFTASTLRYIKIASDIKKYFGEPGERIAEIGTGYGGQCLILDRIFKWNKYYMFDLDLPLQLATRYLEHFILNSSYTCTTLNRYSGVKPLDMVISVVAFSELPSTLQLKYIEKVLAKARKGYLVMNSGFDNAFFKGDFITIDTLKQYIPGIEVIPEMPGALPTDNRIIIWGHKK